MNYEQLELEKLSGSEKRKREREIKYINEHLPDVPETESEEAKEFRYWVKCDILVTEVEDIDEHDFYLYYPVRHSDAEKYHVSYEEAEQIYLQEFKVKNYVICDKYYWKNGDVCYLIDN